MSTNHAIMRRPNRTPSGDADLDDAIDKVAEVIADDLGVDPRKLQAGDDLISDLGYTTDFVGLREERDDLEQIIVGAGLINREEFQNCRTLGDIARRAMKRRSGGEQIGGTGNTERTD